MEWIVFDFGMCYGGIEEIEVEVVVVVDQDCLFVVIGFQCFVDVVEDFGECCFFLYCYVQWVVKFDVGEFQCGWFDVGVFEGFDMEEVGVFWEQEVFFVYVDSGCGDFQQCVGG